MELAFKVFEHAAALIGRTPWEVSRDAELLFQAQVAAFRLYRCQPLIAAIDLSRLHENVPILTRENVPFGFTRELAL